MTITTEAIYEEGVLKLSQPLSIADGTRVEIIVVSAKVSESHTAREILAKLAALPLEGSGDEFSGQDHDKILYPPSNAA